MSVDPPLTPHEGESPPTTRKRPCFDVWICEGRMCTSNGADDLRERANALLSELSGDERARLRVLRGGCFGLCEMGANVVVRRWSKKGRLPDPDVDRLRVTGRRNEVVYSRMQRDEIVRVIRGHLDDDQPVQELTLRAREEEVPAASATARNIRRLRRGWTKKQAGE